MYALAVKKAFIAQHFLVGADFGSENLKHSHHYQIELQLQGQTLDRLGFVVDIVKVQEFLEKLVGVYRDKTLNDLPEFRNLNPSIENLAHNAYRALYQPLRDLGVSVFQVKVWEDDIAWVSYQEE